MVGVVHLPADLWTLRTSAPKLDTTVCQLINRLGIQRRPTKRGCRAGRLVRQRYRPDDDINTTETETETDLPFTATPIPVIYPSRRRTSRSAARLHPSTILRFLGLHHHSVLTTSVTTIPSHRRLAPAFSTRPLRRHGVLLHCRPTINHRILPRLQTILLPQQLPVQHLIIVTVIPSYMLCHLPAVTPRARQHHD